jgi:hypothetical protein
MPSSDFDVVTGPPAPIRPQPRATASREDLTGMPPADPSRSPAEPVPPVAPSTPSPDPRDEHR